MKNFILLNYNLKIDKIYYKDEYKYFYINNTKIYIIEKDISEHELNNLVNISNDLYNKKVYVNTFLLNNENNYYSKRDNNKIMLLRVNKYEEDIDLKNIYQLSHNNYNLINYNVIEEWMNEVDSLEERMLEYNKEYLEIQKSFDYFVGCAENAISLIDNYKESIIKNNNSIGHKVDYKLFKKPIFNDPLTFIKTNTMYDIANYIKYKFLTNKIDYEEIDYIVNNNNEYENAYFFSCLLYPNVYFSLVKNIFEEKETEDKINILIDKIKDYKNILFYVQKIIKNVKQVKLIHWLSE